MRIAAGVALLLLAGCATLGAQQPRERAEGAADAAGVSPPLPFGHWAIDAVRRVEALGLTRVSLTGQPGLSRRVAERQLSEAADRAPADAPASAALVRAWHARLLREFPELDDAGGAPLLWAGGSAAVGYQDRAGAIAPAVGVVLASPPTGLEDRSGPTASLSLAGPSELPVSFLVEPRVGPGGLAVPTWEVVAGFRGVEASVGRGRVAYGHGAGGAVLFGGAPLERVQLYTPRPFGLGGPLRYLGPISVHTFVSRLRADRHVGDPYVLGARVSIQPHPRLTLAANRGAMFGGDSASFGVSPVYLFRTAVGFNSEENQIVSADLRFRAPTERVLPLTAYLEWGADDIAGAYKETPGYVVGAYSPAIPGLPALSLGAERSFFKGKCCGHGFWYRHSRFRGNWVAESEPLGHPLGGHGSETALYGAADLFAARLRLDGRVYRRDRGAENLLAPDRVGSSRGATLDLSWRVSRAELRLRAARESGEGWDEQALESEVRVFF